MASIGNWVIIPVIITSITFIRFGIIIITLINIILLFHEKKIFDNETLKLNGERNNDAHKISLQGTCVWLDWCSSWYLIYSPCLFEEVQSFTYSPRCSSCTLTSLVVKTWECGGGGEKSGWEASNGLTHSGKQTASQLQCTESAPATHHTTGGTADQWPQINRLLQHPPMD